MSTGIVRRATPADIPRLVRLVRTRASRKEIARMLGRGHVLVFDAGTERFGGAAYANVEETDAEGRVVFEILAIDPAFAGQDVERRLAICLLATCETARRRDVAASASQALAVRDQLKAASIDMRWRLAYLMVFLLALPRAVLTANSVAVALCVWSGLAILLRRRFERIPQAIVRRS